MIKKKKQNNFRPIFPAAVLFPDPNKDGRKTQHFLALFVKCEPEFKKQKLFTVL